MATPFSPFTGRLPKPVLKKRQSQVPSELIDWDAPEIPEVEKEKIIYEDYIRELNEDHELQTLLNELNFQVVHDTFIDEYQSKTKKLEDEILKERSKVNLMLGQIRMFETSAKENLERLEQLEEENNSLRGTVEDLAKQKEELTDEKANLQTEIENLNFRNNETNCELNQNLEFYIEKKNEVEELKKKLDAFRVQLAYYKKRAKNKDNNHE